MTRLLTTFILILLFAGCGKDDKNDAQGFSCHETECLKGAEYCVRVNPEGVEFGEDPISGTCHPIPSGCTECECMETDAPTEEACMNSVVRICAEIGNVYRIDCDE